MKILITGATGFVGRPLCEALARKGHELVIITRDPISARSQIPAPHRAIKWDFSENTFPDADQELLQNLGAVIHLAGEPLLGRRWNSLFKDRLYHSRVTQTRNLVSTLKSKCKEPPKVLISASAIGFYGDRKNEVLSEESPGGSDFLAQLCQDWEKASLDPSLSSTRKIALRIGIVLGKGGGALQQMLDPFSQGLGGSLGDGSQWMSWIHLDDLVAVIMEAIVNDKLNGPVNSCAPNPVTNLEFTHSLLNALNRKNSIAIPQVAVKAALGESAMVLLSGQRVAPEKLVKAGFSFRFGELNTALANLLEKTYSEGYLTFQQKCWLPLPLKKVFEFFSDAKNLEKITPPWLGFQVLAQSTENITTGTTIDYRLKLHGIPMSWRTEISSWNPPEEFTDTQLKGPYHTWKHTHRFSTLGDGTLMEDSVLYKIPMGFVGRLVAGSYIKNDVSKIFSYRNKTIYKIFETGSTRV